MYDTVVLSAGALKGIALLGALQSLVDRGLLSTVDRYIGTSVGSIIAYLVCIGYTPIEIMVRLCQTDWLKRMAQFDVFSAVSGLGAVSFSILNDMIEKMTIEKIGRLLTLGALQKEFGKTLICGTYNYTRMRHEFLEPSTRGDLPCLTALRMSSNVPFLFEAFQYEGDYYLDGGLFVGFPLFRVEEGMDCVLGISFRENNDPACVHVSTHNFLNYVYNMLAIPSRHLELLFNERFTDRVDLLEIDLKHFQSLNFQISKNVLLEVFSIGYETARAFIEKKTLNGDASETTRDASETTHDASETTRDASEMTRDAVETTHDASEMTRDAVETTHDASEMTRDAVETTHGAVETTHDASEMTRDAVETTHGAVETTHDAVETTTATRRATR